MAQIDSNTAPCDDSIVSMSGPIRVKLPGSGDRVEFDLEARTRAIAIDNSLHSGNFHQQSSYKWPNQAQQAVCHAEQSVSWPRLHALDNTHDKIFSGVNAQKTMHGRPNQAQRRAHCAEQPIFLPNLQGSSIFHDTTFSGNNPQKMLHERANQAQRPAYRAEQSIYRPRPYAPGAQDWSNQTGKMPDNVSSHQRAKLWGLRRDWPDAPPRPSYRPHMQAERLDAKVEEEVQKAAMSMEEYAEKELLRQRFEQVCRDAVDQTLELKCFGSLTTTFATKASDMDLIVVCPSALGNESDLPRLIEKALLDHNYGARLLTKTRIPIIKLCQEPTASLLDILRKEHAKWEEPKARLRTEPPKELKHEDDESHAGKKTGSEPETSDEQVLPKKPLTVAVPGAPGPHDKDADNKPDEKTPRQSSAMHSERENPDVSKLPDAERIRRYRTAKREGWYDPAEWTVIHRFIRQFEHREQLRFCNEGASNRPLVEASNCLRGSQEMAASCLHEDRGVGFIKETNPSADASDSLRETHEAAFEKESDPPMGASISLREAREEGNYTESNPLVEASDRLHEAREALLDLPNVIGRYRAPPPAHGLDFPKDGVGIQCDINFSNQLALHNSHLLKCYSLCDPRVRHMVLFVKAWSKKRKINSPYNGTLSSYGYVLMALHFLVNIADPPVVPNLQSCRYAFTDDLSSKEVELEGYNIRFFRNETAIENLRECAQITQNKEPVGSLLRGFFHYFAREYNNAPNGGFRWTADVLALRVNGGLLTKQNKGWTGAKTDVTHTEGPHRQTKQVRQRYLFAIEDPFETEHNVARTVVHGGILAIREEFRRAHLLIQNMRYVTGPAEEDLFAEAEAKDNLQYRYFGPRPRNNGKDGESSTPKAEKPLVINSN